MKRSVIALALATVLIVVAACGSKEEVESQPIATAVPTYTATVAGAVQTIAPKTTPETVTEEAHTADSKAEEPAEIVESATDQGVEETTVSAATASDGAAEEVTIEQPAEPVAEPVATAEESPETAAAAQAGQESAEPAASAEPEETTEQAAPDTTEQTSDSAPDVETTTVETTNVETTNVETTPVETTTVETTPVENNGGATDEVDIYAGLPESIAGLMPNADPAHGEQLTLLNGCIGCHNLDPNLVMAGPTWHNVGSTAEIRVEGMTAAQYIYTSIVHPNDYVVEGFAANIMVPTYGETLSEQDQADLVAYLLGVRE